MFQAKLEVEMSKGICEKKEVRKEAYMKEVGR